MRFITSIGSQTDFIQHHSVKPKYHPCPECGTQGKRKQLVTRRIPHLAILHRRSWIDAKVGVYQARCQCCKYFQAPIPGVSSRARYADAVRNAVANAVIRDRMPYGLVIQRMQADYFLPLSLGYVHDCFVWAHKHIDMESHWAFVKAYLSGVLCIDEVHDSGRTIRFATDPLNNFTVGFKLVEKNDQVHMDEFLQALVERGLVPKVVITDGSPRYKDSLQSHWRGVQHQLCIFHVIKELNKLILDGVRAIKNALKRQGHQGRKKRPGRPSKKVQQQRERRQGMSKKEQAAFIWDHQSDVEASLMRSQHQRATPPLPRGIHTEKSRVRSMGNEKCLYILSHIGISLHPIICHIQLVQHLNRLTAFPHSLTMHLQFSIRHIPLLFPLST